MLTELKIKNNGKLIITDNSEEIREVIKLASICIKRNLFTNREPKEYSLNIIYNKIKNKWGVDTTSTTTVYPKEYSFNFDCSDIESGGIEYSGFIRLDQNGFMNEYEVSRVAKVSTEEYTGPICINLKSTDSFSLDIHDKDRAVSVNDGLLKFNDNSAKISVINDLKNKLNKESDKDESE